LSHATSNCEQIALSDGSVCFAEVWGKEDIEEGAGQAFNGIGDGKDGNTLGLSPSQHMNKKKSSEGNTYIFDIWTRVDSDDIAVLDTEVMSNNTVHTCATIIQFIISEDDENSILAFLALHKYGIATEEL
jgi:hypothetical protein